MKVAVVALALVGVALPAWGQNAKLKVAREQIDSLKYADAFRSLDQARSESGNSRTDFLEIVQLQGVCQASMGRPEQAEVHFREWLVLDPSAKLSKRFGPKIQTSFFSAKNWLDGAQPLSLTRLRPELSGGQVTGIGAVVGEDPLHLTQRVVLHVVAPVGIADQRADVTAPGEVHFKVDPTAEVRWWAQLLGPHDEILVELGSATEPLLDHGDAAAVALASPPPAPLAVGAPPPPSPGGGPTGDLQNSAAVNQDAGSTLRPIAYVAGGVGLAALATGVIFGVMASNENAQLSHPTTNAQGTIVGLTQAQAQSLSQQAQRNALLANILVVSGAAVTVAGGGLWIWTALEPSGSGGELGVAGRW